MANNDEDKIIEKEEFLTEHEDETSDERLEHMREGEHDIDVYSEEGREKLIEEGEIEPHEAGFAQGAEGLGKEGHCANCDKMLKEESTIEAEIDGEKYHFCSEKCAEEFRKKHE